MLQDADSANHLTVHDLRAIAEDMLGDVSEGEPLSADWSALISLGVAASVTSLDRTALELAIDKALGAGATFAQIQEAISLVSGLGVHSLMVSCASLADRARAAGALGSGPLDGRERELWDRYVGSDPFWKGFEDELPGFLEAMLRLSPEQFVAFFDYCAVPWKTSAIRARCKELIALASDATPTHRFLPGFKLHLRNALSLGVGRRAVFETLALASAAPPHHGTR